MHLKTVKQMPKLNQSHRKSLVQLMSLVKHFYCLKYCIRCRIAYRSGPSRQKAWEEEIRWRKV